MNKNIVLCVILSIVTCGIYALYWMYTINEAARTVNPSEWQMGGGMVIDPAHLEKELASLREKGVEITPANLKISDRATVCMPWHVAEDGLEEDRLSASGSQFGSTRRGIAYAYGDKYMKKTLRMGDLVHLDEGRKRHLATIVEWKNLTLERVYGAKPIDLEEAWAWCQKYGEMFRDYVCDTGAYLAEADDAGKKIMFEAQLLQRHRRLRPHRRGPARPQAGQEHRHHEGLFFLRGRGPLHRRAGHDRRGKAPAA